MWRVLFWCTQNCFSIYFKLQLRMLHSLNFLLSHDPSQLLWSAQKVPTLSSTDTSCFDIQQDITFSGKYSSFVFLKRKGELWNIFHSTYLLHFHILLYEFVCLLWKGYCIHESNVFFSSMVLGMYWQDIQEGCVSHNCNPRSPTHCKDTSCKSKGPIDDEAFIKNELCLISCCYLLNICGNNE